VTATALGGFLVGAVLLTTETADAGQVEGGGRQVVFAGGGVLGPACGSTPSAESLTVPADGRVRLVNRTGHGARLRLNGASSGSIPDDGSAEVVFHRGTTAVTLDPSCAITDQATPVLVTASSTLTVRPGPIPAPDDPDTDLPWTPSAPADSDIPDEPADSNSAPLDFDAPDIRPQRPSITVSGRPTTIAPTTTAGRPATIRPDRSPVSSLAAQAAATTAARAVPQGGAAQGGKTHRPGGTAGAVAPASSVMPPGDDKTTLPGVPGPALPKTPTAAAPEPPADPRSSVTAVAVTAARPLPDSRPVGLLAVVATVCVLGVTIAVIRAIVSERAYRTNLA
jgi:hypothetical protein